MSLKKDEVEAATAKRMAIVDQLLELLTGPAISSKELGRLRFVSVVFGIAPVIKELCNASSVEGRCELALAAALCALNVALDDTPPQPSERQLERKERREASKQFEATVTRAKSAANAEDAQVENKEGSANAEDADKEPVKSPSIYNRPRAELSPEELERVRKMTAERQARYRAKLKASNGAKATRSRQGNA